MEILNYVQFKVTKGEREYVFLAPRDTQSGKIFIGEMYEVAHELLEQAVQIARETATATAPKEVPVDQTTDSK